MLVSCKWKKYLFFSFLFLILSSFSFALEECQGTMSIDDIPCHILLPINQTVTPCILINVSYYNGSVNIYNQTMTTYNSFLCNSTFNITTVGSYVFYYSTDDSGSIIVTEGIKMIYLLYFITGIIIMMAIYAYMTEDVVFSTISAMGLVILGLYIFTNGFNALNNSLTDFLSLIFVALGFYFFVPAFEWARTELNIVG